MVTYATNNDIPELVDLMNSAYRGERSQKGWTSEAHLIAGEVRTDANNLKDVMSKEGSVFLKYLDKDGKISGCLNLQQHPRGVRNVRPGSAFDLGKVALADRFAELFLDQAT